MVEYNAKFLKIVKDDPIIRVVELKKMLTKDTKSYIFYNLKRDEKINIWRQARSFEVIEGHFENGSWSLNSMEKFKDNLKTIKTPSFLKPENKSVFSKVLKAIKNCQLIKNIEKEF